MQFCNSLRFHYNRLLLLHIYLVRFDCVEFRFVCFLRALNELLLLLAGDEGLGLADADVATVLAELGSYLMVAELTDATMERLGSHHRRTESKYIFF